MTDTVTPWPVALALDSGRRAVSGSESELAEAIRRGADLRIATSFRHDEHMAPGSDRRERVREVADFRVTYLLEDRWTAGIITLRQPVDVPHGFGPRASMSFFMYNQDGQQAIARPYLDGQIPEQAPGSPGESAPDAMPKYHVLGGQDAGTNAPSQNFIYDFDHFHFRVRDAWRELYAHDAEGKPLDGSLDALVAAFDGGCELKVAVRGLCDDVMPGDENPIEHEVFIHLGSCYYYTEANYLLACSHPAVRVAPAVPLAYRTGGWDFGWIMPRTDGLVARMLYDPYTLEPRKSEARHAIRWFAQGA